MQGMKIVNYDQPYFGKQGNKIFFTTSRLSTELEIPKANVNVPTVEVWNYKHSEYQATPVDVNPSDNQRFISVIPLDRHRKILTLQKPGDTTFYYLNRAVVNKDNFILVKSTNLEVGKNHSTGLYLISTTDGTRRYLKDIDTYDYQSLNVSPDCDYILWFDVKSECWICYNVKLRLKKNIGKSISHDYLVTNSKPFVYPFGLAGWLKDRSKALFYDQFDIWQLDLNENSAPINITNGFGRKNNIKLRIATINGGTQLLSNNIILTGINIKTKDNGFFRISSTGKSEPKLLTFGNNAYYFYTDGQNIAVTTEKYTTLPVKAKNAETYVLHRMNAGSYPNLLVTHDFQNYTPITSLVPQNNYNWYSNELIHWTMPDGSIGEGLLYKPADFNPNKKYPIIFYYYEQNALALNLFINPALSNGIMNIPWYVSHGYLVCVPDIKRYSGLTLGPNAYNVVISAANYLMKMPWVNSKKMGLQGHSHGGSETNYLVGNSSLFAAAVTAAGVSDAINAYNRFSQISGTSINQHYYYETGQGGIGATLWERPNLYIENSPILKADRVSTPLLIMHNKEDGVVDFTQGLSWYIALQSLGKKVWMLEYDGEGHTIREPKNQLDFSIRQNQFFDHYLKDIPAPVWMTQGIPSWKKGVDTGYELDPGVQP
jgi:dipeptidyl aminopeptidase/acylaminoacyl peptidase